MLDITPDHSQTTSPPRRNRWQITRITILVALFTVILTGTTSASHTTITSNDISFNNFGTFNGYRIYLSSPRHRDSRSRGECGWEENINGRHLGYYAATGNYYNGQYQPTNSLRNLRSRGYKVVVSANARDDNYAQNINRSDNYGADIHLVTHTNATGSGCPEDPQYYLAMWRDGSPATGKVLAQTFASKVGPTVPGADNSGTDVHYSGRALSELVNPDAAYRVYTEAFFHTNENAVDNWMEQGGGVGKGVKHGSWRYGWAIDVYLGYP